MGICEPDLTFSIHTLGCKVNFAESSAIARRLEELGLRRVEKPSCPDVVVINSCSVTAAADKKCRNLVARLRRACPDSRIVVTGCYATRDPDAFAGVADVVSNFEKGRVVDLIVDSPTHNSQLSTLNSQFFPAYSLGDRTRSFLKVQDGCDYRCSYCTIRAARGPSRNPSIDSLVEQAGAIASAGVREIVLTGVNTGDFGRSTGESFIDLLRALDASQESRVKSQESGYATQKSLPHMRHHRLITPDSSLITRFRISSIEPNLLTDEVVEFCAASPRFMPHFHIPLQSGCDRILGLMRRRYTAAMFADRVAAVRRSMPDAFLGIDVIVGFPGETDDDFAETVAFLERIGPAELHVFPYSVRPDTPAAEMPGRVPPRKIAERARILGELSERFHKDFCNGFKGTKALVLWEGSCKKGVMSGFTENYIRVEAPFDAAMVNTITEIEL